MSASTPPPRDRPDRRRSESARRERNRNIIAAAGVVAVIIAAIIGGRQVIVILQSGGGPNTSSHGGALATKTPTETPTAIPTATPAPTEVGASGVPTATGVYLDTIAPSTGPIPHYGVYPVDGKTQPNSMWWTPDQIDPGTYTLTVSFPLGARYGSINGVVAIDTSGDTTDQVTVEMYFDSQKVHTITLPDYGVRSYYFDDNISGVQHLMFVFRYTTLKYDTVIVGNTLLQP